METKEFNFKGMKLNGILMLFVTIIMIFVSVYLIINGIASETVGKAVAFAVTGVVLLIADLIALGGFVKLEPGEARVMMFFGKYRGTLTDTGYHWVNPFITTKKLSLRARNLDAEPIKVNDKSGNPVMIGLVLVWKDTSFVYNFAISK